MSTANGTATLEAARAYHAAGLNLVPIRRDGSKAPEAQLLPGEWDEAQAKYVRRWEPYQERRQTDEEIATWFSGPNPPGIGVIGGAISGGLECIDFDKQAETIFPAWRELVESEAPGLPGRLSVARTPKPGFHVRYRLAEKAVPGNLKLAVDPSLPPRERTLVETRGEGGYALAPGCPPECHEKHAPYEHHSGPKLSQVQTITAAERDVLIRCARSFDRSPAEESVPRGTGLLPGDAYSANGPDWAQLLEPQGWTVTRQVNAVRYWRRPGKDKGWSATTGVCFNKAGHELLAVFSSSADPFPGPHDGRNCSVHTKFAAFALLDHQGDFKAAAKALAGQGFGDKHKANGVVPVPATPQANIAAAVPLTPLRRLQPYAPFPIEALAEPMAAYVRQGALALGCDPAYLALPALGVTAGLIGYTRVLRLKKTWRVPCVLWTLVVADSGSLKTPAFRLSADYLFAMQRRLDLAFERKLAEYVERKAEWEAKAKKAKQDKQDKQDPPGDKPEQPIPQTVFTSNATIEAIAELIGENRRGLLVASDELASWLGSFQRYKGKTGGTDLQHWLSMHSAGGFAYHRKTGDHRRIIVPHAAVSVTGGIQPGILAHTLDGEFLDAGLGGRLLMGMPPRPAKIWSELEIDTLTEERFHGLLDSLHALDFHKSEGENKPHVLRLTPEAKSAWVRWYNQWAREQAAAEGDLAAAFSKLEEAAARFALLHHVATQVDQKGDDCADVGVKSVEAGITLARWFAAEARRIYATLSESSSERDQRRLVEFIQDRGGQITARELRRSNTRKYPDATHADVALDALVKAGFGTWQERSPTQRGGRPTRVLNLRLTLAKTAKTSDDDDDSEETSTDKTSAETSANPSDSRVSEGFVGFGNCQSEEKDRDHGSETAEVSAEVSAQPPPDASDAVDCPFP